MLRLNHLSLIFAILLSGNLHCQDFNALTSKIFFGVDFKKQDTSLLSDLRAIPGLIPNIDSGWTAYPPIEDGRPIPFYRFNFSKHPYFLSGVSRGGLVVMTNKEAGKVMGISLLIMFQSAAIFDSTYKSIMELYGQYASSTIKRPGIAPPYEVTKFFSKNEKEFVIITKGEERDKPYFHIAYNYLQFEW